MAKETGTKTYGNAELVPVVSPPEQVSADVKIDADDAVAILTSRAETNIRKAIQVAKEKMKTHEKTIAQLRKAREKEVDTFGETRTQAAVKLLKQAVSSLKCSNMEVEIVSTLMSYEKQIQTEITIQGTKPVINWDTKVVAKIPAAVNKITKNIEAEEAALQAAKDECLLWKRKLTDIPSLERRARAAMAEQSLKQTSNGRALIERLSSELELDEGIKLLGVS